VVERIERMKDEPESPMLPTNIFLPMIEATTRVLLPRIPLAFDSPLHIK